MYINGLFDEDFDAGALDASPSSLELNENLLSLSEKKKQKDKNKYDFRRYNGLCVKCKSSDLKPDSVFCFDCYIKIKRIRTKNKT